MPETVSFPRLFARTQRFTLGAPKAFTVPPDGARVVFLRTASGTDRAGALWCFDVDAGQERLVADPLELLEPGTGEELSAAERARRERLREGGAGITGYATDREARVAAFALSSRLFLADLVDGGARELPASGAVIDPRPSPDGAWVAYAAGGALHVVGADGDGGRALAEPGGDLVAFGLAEFAASEELGRYRGFWWSPASDALLVARVDESPVPVWHIGDPANPDREPAAHHYPAAGTANADVTLWQLPLDGGPRTEVTWDREQYPYLVTVHWSESGAPLLQVMTRRQDRFAVLSLDPDTGRTAMLREVADPAWVDVVPGTPAWWDGRLLTVEVVDDRYALCVDGVAVSPAGVQVRAVADVSGDVLALGTEGLGEQHAYRLFGTWWERLTDRPGWHSARGASGTLVVARTALDGPLAEVVVTRNGVEVGRIASRAVQPPLRPTVELLPVGEREIPTAVLWPAGWSAADGPLPVLMNPYGGPHGAQVVASQRPFLESQWWADQGFCVVVADGRGTPGAPSWERAVRLDVATVVLEDQVAALRAVAAAHPGALDLDRVAIRGWSFGGFLSALAVLRRPDVFHVAVAGAPVTDWTLYDTAYTERYLGLPQEQPQAYAVSSLLDDAAGLSRPLMIIHGLADDNVVAAHSLRLSSALLAAGRPHTLLPLSGVTHMTPQEVVAENLLLLQRDFLLSSLRPVRVRTTHSSSSP